KPGTITSLKDDSQEFQRLVNEVWGSGNANVHTGKTIAEVLTALNVPPDFEYTKSQEGTQLLYVHRKLTDGDIYWVNNRSDRNETVDATSRVSGKTPQI